MIINILCMICCVLCCISDYIILKKVKSYHTLIDTFKFSFYDHIDEKEV